LDNQIQTEDPYAFERWRYNLYGYWASNWRAHKKAGTKMEIRQGIGCLLELVFALRFEATHIYKLVISSEWGSHLKGGATSLLTRTPEHRYSRYHHDNEDTEWLG